MSSSASGKRGIWMLALGASLGLAILLHVAFGPGGYIWQVPLDTVWLRILRMSLGLIAGGTLALAGAALQALLRNPLADPYTLGTASGAAFGSTLLLFLGAASSLFRPLGGIAGALVTTFLVYSLARKRGKTTATGLVLAGVIVGFFFTSLVLLLIVIGRRPMTQAIYVLMGYLGTAFTHSSVGLYVASALVVLLVCVSLSARGRVLDIISTQEDSARSLGVDTAALTRTVFLLASTAVGIVVAFVGAVSFVGLVVPHLVRLLLGPRNATLLPGSFLLGGALLLMADLLARNVASGVLPLSVVTSLVGIPFFVYLLRRRL